MGLTFRVLLIIVIISSYLATAEGAWQGPSEMISGTWGPNNDQFGITYGDTNDVFAGPIYVMANGQIVIQDVINARYKVYGANGTLIKALKCIEISPDVYNEECNFDGDYLQITPDGNFWVNLSKDKQSKYSLYSPTGQLIKTSITKPLELGIARTSSLGGGRYRHKVQYPDATYYITSDKEYDGLFRDEKKSVYLYLQGLVDKFNVCGKLMGRLLLPQNMEVKGNAAPSGEQYVYTHDQYGEPVLDIHGNVYTWKKSPTKYSILKWTWVDDPNVPTGPDAPSGLTIMPSTMGLYLTWTASPSDPGCVTGYEVSRATSAGGVGSTVATVNAGVVKYNDTTATAGTMYYYKVRAVAGSEYSPFTTEVSGKR